MELQLMRSCSASEQKPQESLVPLYLSSAPCNSRTANRVGLQREGLAVRWKLHGDFLFWTASNFALGVRVPLNGKIQVPKSSSERLLLSICGKGPQCLHFEA